MDWDEFEAYLRLQNISIEYFNILRFCLSLPIFWKLIGQKGIA